MIFLKRIFFVLSLLILVFACSLDDGVESIPPPNFDVIGLWDLVEVNVSPSQDLNNDGTMSTNLINELDCISGTLLIDGDLVWTYEQTQIITTPITNDRFSIICSDTIFATGTWFSDENEATFDGNEVLTALRIDGERLVNDIGEDLPGIQSFVYERRIVN